MNPGFDGTNCSLVGRAAQEAGLDDATASLSLPLRRVAVTAIGLLAIPLALYGAVPTPAQGSEAATPTRTVSAADCQVDPRPPEDFDAIADATPGSFAQLLEGTPAATVVVPTDSVSAEPEVVEAVTAAIEQIVACTATGDIARFSALWTDDYFRRSLGGASSSAELSTILALTPVAVAEPVPLPVVEAVGILPDGRVAVETRNQNGRGLSIFVESDGRYLLDDSSPLEEGTPTP